MILSCDVSFRVNVATMWSSVLGFRVWWWTHLVCLKTDFILCESKFEGFYVFIKLDGFKTEFTNTLNTLLNWVLVVTLYSTEMLAKNFLTRLIHHSCIVILCCVFDFVLQVTLSTGWLEYVSGHPVSTAVALFLERCFGFWWFTKSVCVFWFQTGVSLYCIAGLVHLDLGYKIVTEGVVL